MEREGGRRVGSLPRPSMKHRQKTLVTHLLCLCQPASPSVSLFSPPVCFCLHLSLPHSCLFVGLYVTHTPKHSHAHTHTHPILITHPPIQDDFHWDTMKWPSDHTHWANLNLASLSSPPLRGFLWLSLRVDRHRKRQRATDDCLKGENNSIS